jgi:PKD repeat protein
VIVAGVTIVGVVLWSQPPPQKIPHVSAIISNKSCTVYLYHNGGDVLVRQQFQILIDGTNQTANFTMIGGANPWTSWGNGDTLQYTPATCAQLPRRADIIFNDGTVNAVISTVFFGAGLPTPTPAPTPIPAPVADFSGTPLSGTAPLLVTFTDTSSNTPTSWTWEYRNATTGWTVFNITQNATFSFAAAGIYSINLTATNAGGSGNLTRDTYITVTIPPPVAGFTGTPLSGTAPLSVAFTDTSSNTPTSWVWGAKNLTPGNNTWFQFNTIQNPVQVFGVGNWSINLTATNAAGSNISTQITWVNVSIPPPVASFTGTPLSGTTPLSVTFTDTSSNTPTSWKWGAKNLTPGNNTWFQFSTIQNPVQLFGVGNWSINLTATNAVGSNISTQITWVNVTIPPPVASFTGTPLSGTTPLSVTFTDTSSNTPTSWKWGAKNLTPGNNTWFQFSTIQNPVQVFGVGNWSINLTATNAVGSNISTQITWVNVSIPLPVASFTGTPLSGTAPLSVTFTDTSSNTPTSWKWGAKNLTPGNNTWFQFSTIQNPVQVFGVGNWSINLTATNAAGSNISTQITWVNVTPLPPVAGFTGTPLSGIAPLLVAFTDSSSNIPTSWRWSFKNATTGWTVFSTTQNPTFSFPKGRYDINLTATNAGGSNTLTRNNYITTYTIVSFTTSTTWTVPTGVTSVEYLVIAGGGGGGSSRTFANKGGGGGGGAGGFITGTGFVVTPTALLTVTIGAGGAGGAQGGGNMGTKGGNSSFANTTAGDGINAMGGGSGAGGNSITAGGAGGSGGGGHQGGAGGAGISGQGYNGGSGWASAYLDGGGGGSGQAGSDATGSAAGKGGDGTASSISGSSVTYAGGGGGGSGTAGIAGAAGGSGGGGAGGALNVNNGAAATGYGSGGGGGTSAVSGGASRAGGNGSNGIVIIMYQDP